MYHISMQSQIKKQTNSQNSYILVQSKNYIADCTPYQARILKFILRFRNSPFIKLTNGYIADRLGCSQRTVIRATNKFMEDGVIFKQQENTYAPNEYFINKEKVYEKQELFYQEYKKQNALSDGNVIHKKSSKRRDINKNNPVSRVPVNGRYLEVKLKKEYLDVKNLIHPRTYKGSRMNRDRSEMIETITRQLDMTERESLKLGIYPSDILHKAIRKYHAELKRPRRIAATIRDKVGFFFSIANKLCLEQDIHLDWSLFISACSHLGIDLNKKEQAKSYSVSPIADVTTHRQIRNGDYVSGSVDSGLYKPWSPTIIPVEEEIVKLEKSIAAAQKFLSEGKFNLFLTLDDVKNNIARDESRLSQLKKESAFA